MNYERLFKKAKAFGEKVGLGSEAEDFAQECLLKAFEVGAINLNYMWLNYRDYHRADKRILSSPCGQLSKFRTISLDATIDSSDEDSAKLGELVGDAEPDVGRREELNSLARISENLRGRTKDIFEGLLEGLNRQEIAKKLGVSASRVTQIIKNWSIDDIVFIYIISPKQIREWVLSYAFASRKSGAPRGKKRAIKFGSCKSLKYYRKDGEVSSYEHLQEVECEISSGIDCERAIYESIRGLYERSIAANSSG